jgi:uncharacterized tellurite resistance protein B-like protein
MLSTLKELFDSLQPRPATESSGAQEHMLQLAAAVLLVEVMRSDVEMAQAERAAVLSALQHRFDLAADELGRLMELAEQTSRDAHDYHRFTSKINEGFDLAQKVRMIESLWQVAYADGRLSADENQVISKIADLIHVPHGAYINAKMRAKQAAGHS